MKNVSTLAAKICPPLAVALLVFSTGCGHDHQTSCAACSSGVADAQTYRQVEPIPSYSGLPPVQQTYAPPPPMAFAPPPSNTDLRGPRPQAEIDALYAGIKVNPIPPPAALPPAPAPASLQTGPIPSGEASWNVPLSREWKHIVVHHSASPTGSAASFDKAHRDRGWDGLGYHFVIGNGSGSGDGQVEVGYRWVKQQAGAHAGNYEYNQHGVGVCLVGDFEHHGPPSPRQMASLRQLLSFLQSKANIPANEIIGHGNVPGRSTECPGRHLDMNALRASLGSVTITPSPAPAKQPIPETALLNKPQALLVKAAVKLNERE